MYKKPRIRKDGKKDQRYKAPLIIGTDVKTRPEKVNQTPILRTLLVLLMILVMSVSVGYFSSTTLVAYANEQLTLIREARAEAKPKILSPVIYSCMGDDCHYFDKEVEKVENEQKEKDSWTGIGSWYSVDGCVGCRADRLMANGEVLKDDAYTVAFNYAPLGTWVKIINNDTDDATIARVTDTGGFNALGRIIDMTPAVRNSIDCSDLCNVTVERVL